MSLYGIPLEDGTPTVLKVVRVMEERVEEYLDKGYEFCNKELWKELVRDK
jgi:hypothetical protein